MSGPFEEGEVDFSQGLTSRTNPYPLTSSDAGLWDSGWKRAQQFEDDDLSGFLESEFEWEEEDMADG